MSSVESEIEKISHSVSTVELQGMSLQIRDVITLNDGIYLVKGKATGEGVIPKGWTPVVSEYLTGKPNKWRHERDKSLGDWKKAVYGEVHASKMVGDGEIEVEFHLFGSSTAHESLIEEVSERQKNNNPMGLSITTEQHSRNGKLTLVIPTEVTLTNIPECVSCRTLSFSEEKHPMSDQTAATKTAVLAVGLQEQLTKSQAENQKLNEVLQVSVNETEQLKERLAEATKKVETFDHIQAERDQFLKDKDELTDKLAKIEKERSEQEREPLIKALEKAYPDDAQMHTMYREHPNVWTKEKLEERLKQKGDLATEEFETSSSTPAPGKDAAKIIADQVTKQLRESGNPELLALLEERKKQDAAKQATA